MFNFYIDKASFPNTLKQADITPFQKKMIQMIKTIIDQSAYYLLCKAIEKCLYDQIYGYNDSILLRPNATLEKTAGLSIQLLQ